MINRSKFFDGVRHGPFPGKINAVQVQNLTAILNEWERRKLTDLRWLAYIMATIFHECGQQMAPVREGFCKTDAAARAYVKRNNYSYAIAVNGRVYYGRGWVQLTWLKNYRAMTALLNAAGIHVDLVTDPDFALRLDIAAFVTFEGMIRGTFTAKGYKLADFFNSIANDPTQARRIINGMDKAAQIATYHKQFFADLMLAA